MHWMYMRRFWLGYLVLCAALAAELVIEVGLLDDPRDPYLALSIAAISFVALVPVYGLATERALGPRWMWWCFLVLAYVTLAIGLVGLIGFTLRNESAAPLDRVLGLVGLLLNAGYLVALHTYLSRRSSPMGGRTAAEA